jgi:hypothetical protein
VGLIFSGVIEAQLLSLRRRHFLMTTLLMTKRALPPARPTARRARRTTARTRCQPCNRAPLASALRNIPDPCAGPVAPGAGRGDPLADRARGPAAALLPRGPRAGVCTLLAGESETIY